MSGKKNKLMRKASKELGLHYKLQKKIHKTLNTDQKKTYGHDVKMLLDIKRNEDIQRKWKNGEYKI